MKNWLNRNIVLPLAAWKNKSSHLRHLKYLQQTQFDSLEEIRKKQWMQTKLLLIHAFETVPFYRYTWQKAKVSPGQIRTLEDLRILPVVTKEDIREFQSHFVSAIFDKTQLITKRTSGSTGIPLTIQIDEQGKQWKQACTIRSDEWSGYQLGQRVAKVWGNPEYRQNGFRGQLRNFFVERATYLDTLAIEDSHIQQFIAKLQKKQPGLLFGHAHSLFLLANRLKKDGISDIRPNGIISTAMPLHTWQRRVIHDVFGVNPTDRYGCEEMSLIASECEEHHGLHINADSVYCEIEQQGNSGNLLVTDLSNFAMPLIRYRIGDVATLSNRECPCGRGLPLIETVQGREADFVVTPNGKLISGISLTENFALHIRGTAQVQIVQETVHHLRIRLVADPTFNHESERQIARLVHETFGQDVRHEVEQVDAIPQEASGKYRFCISKVAKDELRAVA